MTAAAVAPLALNAAGWATRWHVTRREAEELLLSMPAGLVEEEADGRWRASELLLAEYGPALRELELEGAA